MIQQLYRVKCMKVSSSKGVISQEYLFSLGQFSVVYKYICLQVERSYGYILIDFVKDTRHPQRRPEATLSCSQRRGNRTLILTLHKRRQPNVSVSQHLSLQSQRCHAKALMLAIYLISHLASLYSSFSAQLLFETRKQQSSLFPLYCFRYSLILPAFSPQDISLHMLIWLFRGK